MFTVEDVRIIMGILTQMRFNPGQSKEIVIVEGLIQKAQMMIKEVEENGNKNIDSNADSK